MCSHLSVQLHRFEYLALWRFDLLQAINTIKRTKSSNHKNLTKNSFFHFDRHLVHYDHLGSSDCSNATMSSECGFIASTD